jgi:hypothetical protein
MVTAATGIQVPVTQDKIIQLAPKVAEMGAAAKVYTKTQA